VNSMLFQWREGPPTWTAGGGKQEYCLHDTIKSRGQFGISLTQTLDR